MRLAIIGSSRVIRLSTIEKAIDELDICPVTEIATNSCFGTSKVISAYAKSKNIEFKYYLPKITLGKFDLITSDLKMFRNVDLVLVFDDPDCRRTSYLLRLASMNNKLPIRHFKTDLIDRLENHKKFMFLDPLPTIQSSESFVYVDSDTVSESDTDFSEWSYNDYDPNLLDTDTDYYDDETYEDLYISDNESGYESDSLR
jgi:hypothetical protein